MSHFDYDPDSHRPDDCRDSQCGLLLCILRRMVIAKEQARTREILWRHGTARD
jgi:hypothetical protein